MRIAKNTAGFHAQSPIYLGYIILFRESPIAAMQVPDRPRRFLVNLLRATLKYEPSNILRHDLLFNSQHRENNLHQPVVVSQVTDAVAGMFQLRVARLLIPASRGGPYFYFVR